MKYITAFLLMITMSFGAHAQLIHSEYSTETVIPSTIGGYTMSEFEFDESAFRYGDLSGGLPVILMDEELASDNSWFNTAPGQDYEVFITNENIITLIMPENTFAFSLNVGANLRTIRDNAWLTVAETSGTISEREWFNVSRNNTPGFSFHSTSNTVGDCSHISSVTLDPLEWGFGNFAINQGTCEPVAQVPEPATFALFGAGLVGLGFGRKKMKNSSSNSSQLV
jgi:hypothetical protein|tara:strand:+ start:13394 stop:14068 length:675 start_codon:yes stop_codon:yes gene_type:complete